MSSPNTESCRDTHSWPIKTGSTVKHRISQTETNLTVTLFPGQKGTFVTWGNVFSGCGRGLWYKRQQCRKHRHWQTHWLTNLHSFTQPADWIMWEGKKWWNLIQMSWNGKNGGSLRQKHRAPWSVGFEKHMMHCEVGPFLCGRISRLAH